MSIRSIYNKLRRRQAYRESSEKRESATRDKRQNGISAPLSSAMTDSLFSDGSKVAYDTSYANIDIKQQLNHKQLRKSARTAVYDSPVAAGIVNRFTDSVVDTGLIFNLSPDFTVLNIKPSSVSDKIKDYNNRFKLWCKSKQSMLNAQMNFFQEQRFVCKNQQRDGDGFIRIHYDFKDKKLMSPIRLENIDPDNVFGAYDENNRYHQDRTIIDGIEYDNNGSEIAYYVKVVKNYKISRIKVDAFDKKSGLPLMLHYYKIDYANQKRGLPSISNILHSCEQLKTFTHAQITSAIIQASISLFNKPSKDEDSQPPIEMAMNAQFDIDSNLTDEAREAQLDADTQAGLVPDLTYRSVPGVNLIPGAMGYFGAKKGQELQAFEPKTPVPQFKDFYESFVTILSSSQNMPYEYLTMKFGENYSASRASILMAYRAGLVWLQELQTDILDPIKNAWFTCEIAKQKISMPGFSDPTLKEAWLNGNWFGPPLLEIDRGKTIQAATKEIEIGVNSLSRVSQELNGTSYEDNVNQLQAELAQLPEIPWQKAAK